MRKKRSELLDRSLAWIRAHAHATNLDVPTAFLVQWIFEDDDADPKPAGFSLSVFAFGYMQHELLCGTLPPSVSRTVRLDKLIELFARWQLKLALAEIHRRTEVQVAPTPLFEFPDDEEVRYWPRPTDAKAEASR